MIPKKTDKNRVFSENGTFNELTDQLNGKGHRKHFQGVFWPAMCFNCPKKRTEALTSFVQRLQGEDSEIEAPDLRTCKVCVKYAMRLSETRKQLDNLERFFHIKKS